MSWNTPWKVLLLVVLSSFAVLLYAGHRIQQEAPPIPSRVISPDGEVLIAPDDISSGQNVWQAMGGMQVGSIWGHGSYVAPDWTADYLHRESMLVLDQYARGSGAASYDAAPPEAQAAFRSRLQRAIRTSTYDPATGTVVLTAERAEALRSLRAHYTALFRDGRTEFAIPRGAQADARKAHLLTSFFFWSSWAASTDRP